LIHLTGNPRALSEGREIIASEFVVDRATGKFKPLPPFQIRIEANGPGSFLGEHGHL